MAFIKVKKLNLKINDIKKALEGNPFFSTLGITKEGIDEIPEEETVYINTDNIIAITDATPTCIGDNSKCVKVYFSTENYWVIEYDESVIDKFKSLL